MYKVMIVEDELLVRIGLKNTVDWARFNMELVADAPDGKTAFEIYEKIKPDLILTDIKMPFMDGIELITKIREKDKEIKIIILSCLEEFDLVRKAMTLGVSDYILKLTMTEEEIENILAKLKEELDKSINNSLDSGEEQLKNDIIKNQILKDFLIYKVFSEEKFKQYVKKYNLMVDTKEVVVSAIEIDDFYKVREKFKDDSDELIKTSIMNVLQEILEKYKAGEAIFESRYRFVLLLNAFMYENEEQTYEEISKIINNIISIVEHYLNISLTFGVSSIGYGYSELHNLYVQAADMLEYKFFFGKGKIYIYDSYKISEITEQKISVLAELKGLSKLFNERMHKDYKLKLQQFLSKKVFTKDSVKDFLQSLLQWTFYSLFSVLDEKILDSSVSYNSRIQSCETFDEGIEVYKDFINSINESIYTKNLFSKEIYEAVLFINSNYEKNISLHSVADFVHLSPSYLSNLFKKETKKTFIEYLNNLRIEKAKELLITSSLKSYEVAERIGFTENTYFCKVFKKQTGFSPNEFRRQWLSVEDLDEEG